MTEYVHQTAVKIRSWHLMSAYGPYKTLCGKVPMPAAPELAKLPAGEKTCERCLQIDKRAQA